MFIICRIELLNAATREGQGAPPYIYVFSYNHSISENFLFFIFFILR